jgi:predicted N-acetyltransferase YhbS
MRPARAGTSGGVSISAATRANVLGLCLLNAATFDTGTPARSWRLPGARVASSFFSLHRRLHLNHVLVATAEDNGAVVGSVEVHTVDYLTAKARPRLTPEQAAVLQPYMASLAVREDYRRAGVGESLVLVRTPPRTAPTSVHMSRRAHEGGGGEVVLRRAHDTYAKAAPRSRRRARPVMARSPAQTACAGGRRGVPRCVAPIE